MFSCRVGLGPCQTLAPTTEGAIIPAEPKALLINERGEGAPWSGSVLAHFCLQEGRKGEREPLKSKHTPNLGFRMSELLLPYAAEPLNQNGVAVVQT